MPIPASITAITVSGSYLGADGSPRTGYVTFTPSVTGNTDGVILPIAATKVELDEAGAFEVDLMATDDPDWEAPDFTYEVTETITGAVTTRRTYNIEVPAASPDGELDLALAAPVSTPGTPSVFVEVSGGTMTGDLIIGTGSDNMQLVVKADGAEDLASLPNGTTAKPGTNGVYLIGSATGGEDDGSGVDTTPHVNSYHYQRAQTGSFGESLRHHMMKSDAKAAIAWWFPTAGYDDGTDDPEGSNWKPQAWVVAHAKANDGLSYHNHLSFEVMSPSNGLTTRLEIPFVDQESWEAGDPYAGVSVANIRTSDADFSVRASSGVLRVGGGNSSNKDILLSLSSDRAATGERWKIRADSTTEAGSNAGTDFSIRNYGDTGTSIGIPLFIKRSTSRVAFGGAGAADATGAHVSVIWPGASTHGIRVTPSATPGNAAGFSAQMTATTDRALEARIPAESSSRYVLFTDGKQEFGDGGGTRDVNLYRSAADKLATDDDFLINAAGKGIRIKEGSNAKMGTSTLVGGTVAVSNTSVTANSRIMLTVQSLGTVVAPKAVAVTARTASTSFTITSADATDTSVVAWHIVEPA